eukprot:8068512-Alexandrium_andersonii.AAC.1
MHLVEGYCVDPGYGLMWCRVARCMCRFFLLVKVDGQWRHWKVTCGVLVGSSSVAVAVVS